MISIATIRKCVYPFPVYQAHFADNTVVRMSVWQPLGKPWAFERFRKCLSKSGRRQILDGYLEHDVPGKPLFRVQDPVFSGAPVGTKPKRKSTVALRKWAENFLRQNEGQLTALTQETVNDLRAAFDQAA